MLANVPSKKLHVDAVLTRREGHLVEVFCGGAWEPLPKLWTIRTQDVLDEAARRGLECFVSARPDRCSEDFHVLPENDGFVSCYVERGSIERSSIRRFTEVEKATMDMLRRRMESLGVPP